MSKIELLGILSLATVLMPALAGAEQNFAEGSVTEYTGLPGELIVSRDSVIYYLSTGDDLFGGDILRSREGETTTIVFRGCEMELPASEDVALDDEFCVLAAVEEPTMAAIASTGDGTGVALGAGGGLVAAINSANAPLMVGGVVLSAGGIAATTGGDGGGAGAATRQAAGNPSSESNSP